MISLLNATDLKALLAPVSVLIGIYLLLRKHHLQIRLQKQKEIKLVEKLTANAKKNAHPFVIEKQYAAITGDSKATAGDILFLLRLPSPTSAIRKFSKSRNFVEVISNNEKCLTEVRFKKKFLSRRRRTISKALNLASYGVFGMASMSPLFFIEKVISTIHSPGDAAPFAAVSISCGFIAFSCLNDAVKLKIAEEFVEMGTSDEQAPNSHSTPAI